MSLTGDQKSSKTFKLLTFGVAETNTNRNGSEEPFLSGVLVKPQNIYSDWDLIPNTAPILNDGESSGVVMKYVDLVLTAVSGTLNSFYHNNLKDCIPFNTGDGSYNYIIKNNLGTRIPFGQGDWVLDTIAGVLTFYGTVPSNMPPKITFYKYIGNKGGGESLWETADAGFIQPIDSNKIHQSVVENLETDLGKKSDKNPSSISEAQLNNNSVIRFWDTNTQTEKKIKYDDFLKILGSFIKRKTAVRWATKLIIQGTYDNGVSGVGATYTITSEWWQSMDYYQMGGNVQIGDSFLFWTCQNAIHNGIYTLTSGGYNQNSIFTRIDVLDESTEIYDGLAVFVQESGAYAGCGFIQTANDPIIIGSSNINFVQFSKSGVFSADNTTITLNGLVFSIAPGYTTKINEAYEPSTEKTTIVDNDTFTMNDNEAVDPLFTKIKVKFSTLKTALSSFFWGKNDELTITAGTKTQPLITYNGDGTVSISSFTCNLFSNTANTGACKLYTIPALSNVAISNNVYYYLIASYNGGTPVATLITNNTTINHSDVINVAQFVREVDTNGTDRFRKFFTGNYGAGLANKTAHRLIHTERFGYQEGGLLASVSYLGGVGFRINITSGVLWYDGLEINIPALLNNNYPLNRYTKSSGQWINSLTDVINATYYNNGTTEVTLSNNKYAVTWLYAMVDGVGAYTYSYLIGEGDYSLSEAQASSEPAKPDTINKLGKLIYRIIIQKGATTITELKPYHTNNAGGTTATDKESVIGLRLADSPEFADVQITNLSQNSYFLNTAKSILSAINSLLTSVSQFFTDTKNFSGNVLSESPKYKVNFTYSGGNIVATMAFVGANTTAFYKLFGKRMVLTTSNIASYTKSATASEGTWFFYIDASTSNVDSPVLVLSKTAWDVKAGHILLDTVKFNATDNTFIWQGYDKHLYDRNIYWHKNEHTLGAIGTTNGVLTHNNGLSSTLFATNTDNNFGRAMIQLASCVMQDEELTNTVIHSDASVASTVANPYSDYAGVVEQFLGFTAIATTGTNATTIVFPTSHTLIAGQAVQVMSGNSTTTRGTTTITTGGTGTTFTVASVTGMQSGDAIVLGARIPILYLATGGLWRKLATTSFLAVSGGAACDATTIVSGTMQYNDAVNGGFVNMNTNRYYCVYLLQTNHYSEPIKAILSQGQSSNGTLATALTESFAQFANLVGLSALEIQEVVSLKRLTFIYNTGAQFTNTKAKLVDVTNLSFRINSLGNVSVGGGGSSIVSAGSVIYTPTTDTLSTETQSAVFEKISKNLTSYTEATSVTDNTSLFGFWDTTNSIFRKISWQNFKSIFVNLTDINVSTWINGEQRLLLARNNNGVAAFDGAAELLDIYAPPANAATLLVDSGWTNEQKTLTGDNTLGQLGKVGQIIWLDNKTFCQVISATYTSSASVTYYRNRCFDNLDPSTSTQDAAVLNVLDPSYTYPAMTPTGNSTDLGWDLASQTKILTVAARVGTWAVGGLSGEGYTYMCFKVSGSNTYWKRNGNPSFIQREITSSSHPNLVAALRAYDFTLGKYTQSGLETSYQDQTFSDDTNGYYYIKTDATKWTRFDALVSPRKTTLTNAQIKALATTAVTVVAQSASGYAHIIRGITLSLRAGTEALTVDATTTFIVRYVGGQMLATFTAIGFIDSTTNKIRYTTQITLSDSSSGIDNKAIEIVNTGTQISGNASNNATLDVLVNYTTIKL